MLKKNYIIKNIKDEDEIFNDLVKIYYKIEDIKKINDDNIVGVLFHELMAFFVTSKCQINSKKYSKLYKSQQKFHFGKRQGVDILKKKNNSLLTKFLYKVYSFFSNSLFFNKKIFLGKNISLSLGDKLSLIFFCTLKRYKLIILDIEDIKINLNSKTELFFLKEIKKLLIKNNINLKNLIDIKKFIKTLRAKKTLKTFLSKKNLIISGTLGNIENRLLAIKKSKLNSKLMIINHIPTYGYVSYKALRYDEFFLCDYYLTPGKKKIFNDPNYYGIDRNNYNILSIENKFTQYASNIIKEINFNKIKKNKILYIPARVTNILLLSKSYIEKRDYENWQNFLVKKFGRIDVKFPSKRFDYNINKKFNILDNKLKLLELSSHYDFVILDYISSGTFGEIATTNVPILYFNLGRDEINKEAKKIITKRVHEIKIDIFSNYEGFDLINSLGKFRKKKNIFNLNNFNHTYSKTFYNHLLDINKSF